MKDRSHKRQILLFLIAVILPCFILIFSTIRMIDQEKELSQSRLLEERQSLARDIGRRLLIRLETIKLQERQAIANMPQSFAEANYFSPEVVFVGIIKEGRVVFPWELNPDTAAERRLLTAGNFGQLITKAEREEFIDKNYARAAESYRRATQTAADPVQKEYARLMLARSLAKSNRQTEANGQYLRLLTQPSHLEDENGMPLFLYAAQGLLAGGANYPEIMDRLQSELESPRWFSPAIAFRVSDVLDTLLDRIEDSALAAKAEGLKRVVQNRIRILEQALAVRQDFPGLFRSLGQGADQEKEDSIWISWGEIPWLLSLSKTGQGTELLLVAADQDKALSSMKAEEGFRQAFPQDFSLSADAGIEGEDLGPNFAGLKAVISSSGTSFPADNSDFRTSFYILALVLILSITFFGAYLLWRNIRRDVRMADLRSQFVSSVSHELKTPLTAIRMFAETLRLGRAKDAKTRDEYLETIVNESQRLTRLLNNVLDFSKIEEGKRIYKPEPASLNEIVRTAARAMEYPLTQQGFRLLIKADEELPEVWLDRDAIEQAILNLLHNAVKYSGMSRDIELKLQNKDGQALIQVIDHGIGIEPKEKERIFDKFYRVPSSNNERLPGTGLGLALVAHIVEAHNGRIEVESTPGLGSKFSIFLPLSKES
jgi:signal transduction histidine kinase